MIKIRLEEARERLDDLVRRAERGERIIILKNNRPIAELVGLRGHSSQAREAVAKLLKRPRTKLSLEQIREFVEEGRL